MNTTKIDVNGDLPIAASFEAALKLAYPGGISMHQAFELWQFYLMGAAHVFIAVQKYAEHQEDDACRRMDALDKDLRDEAAKVSALNRARAAAMDAGRN